MTSDNYLPPPYAEPSDAEKVLREFYASGPTPEKVLEVAIGFAKAYEYLVAQNLNICEQGAEIITNEPGDHDDILMMSRMVAAVTREAVDMPKGLPPLEGDDRVKP